MWQCAKMSFCKHCDIIKLKTWHTWYCGGLISVKFSNTFVKFCRRSWQLISFFFHFIGMYYWQVVGVSFLLCTCTVEFSFGCEPLSFTLISDWCQLINVCACVVSSSGTNHAVCRWNGRHWRACWDTAVALFIALISGLATNICSVWNCNFANKYIMQTDFQIQIQNSSIEYVSNEHVNKPHSYLQ